MLSKPIPPPAASFPHLLSLCADFEFLFFTRLGVFFSFVSFRLALESSSLTRHFIAAPRPILFCGVDFVVSKRWPHGVIFSSHSSSLIIVFELRKPTVPIKRSLTQVVVPNSSVGHWVFSEGDTGEQICSANVGSCSRGRNVCLNWKELLHQHVLAVKKNDDDADSFF